MKESDLREGEKILCVVRHHGLFLFWPIVFCVVSLGLGLVHFSLLGLLVFGIPWLLYRMLVLRTDIWTITDRRLVDREGIISRTVKESPFEKIHNASYTQSLFGRIFNYGDVTVQTASTEGYSELKMVRAPARVKSILMEAVDADLENRPAPSTA